MQNITPIKWDNVMKEFLKWQTDCGCDVLVKQLITM